MTDSTKAKKSYSKKPSKKERLASEIAKKERISSGGVHIREDGVAVSAVALAARQAALAEANQNDDVPATHERGTRNPHKIRAQAHLTPVVAKIEAPTASGRRKSRRTISCVTMTKFVSGGYCGNPQLPCISALR